MTPRDLYFRWLCEWVDVNGRFGGLMKCLDSMIFVPVNPMDENRASDGRYMRYVYRDQTGNDSCRGESDCSVLEFLIGFAWRLSYNIGNIQEDWGGDQGVAPWFWTMVHNIKLDAEYGFAGPVVDEKEAQRKVEKFMYRNYDYYGHGGLFVVDHPLEDMRDAELWDQANWYLTQERPHIF